MGPWLDSAIRSVGARPRNAKAGQAPKRGFLRRDLQGEWAFKRLRQGYLLPDSQPSLWIGWRATPTAFRDCGEAWLQPGVSASIIRRNHPSLPEQGLANRTQKEPEVY